jgi:nicotinate-nucleotide adenylyltransferase
MVAAECARDAYNLDRVLFVPAARPPHKHLNEVLDSRYRYEMVKLAIQENPFFEISRLEMDRKGPSYTVETVSAFLREFPGAEIYFIIGVDALLLINTWRNVELLASMCSFIVVTRPGYELSSKEEHYSEIPAVVWEKIRLVAIPEVNISSSDIRHRAANGQTIKYLVPPVVEEYIKKNSLYRAGKTVND